jgi:hypothetical protein
MPKIQKVCIWYPVPTFQIIRKKTKVVPGKVELNNLNTFDMNFFVSIIYSKYVV